MIRILAFSDIHSNLGCVRKLRAQEQNSFDAVVIAGDLGSEAVPELLKIVCTFDCPVYYVYGNWDNQLGYEEKFHDQAQILHMQVEALDGLYLAGYSGCQTHWGKNPIFLQLEEALRNRHAALLASVEMAYTLAKSEYEQFHQQRAATPNARTVQGTKQKIGLIRIPSVLDSKSERKKKAIWKDYENLVASAKYKSYLEEKRQVEREVEKQNRQRLFAVVREFRVDASKVMLVTHERLFRVHEEIEGIGFHLFGHLHGFKHTVFKGVNYVNVSALDKVACVHVYDDWYNVNVGSYSIIDFGRDGQSRVQCRRLHIDDDLTLREYCPTRGENWLPSEVQFL